MVVQEPVLEEYLQSKDMNGSIDESEETLSLSDLPLYSDQSADWDHDFSSASNSINSDYFEFFSQEFNPAAASAAAAFPPENIIFCGKLIPTKQKATRQLEINSQTEDNKKRRRCRLFRSTTTLMHQSQPKRMYNTGKRGRLGLGRMSIFTASSTSSSPGKAKWYLLLFGISRFSPVIEMRDIKSRQSRRQPPLPSSSPPRPMIVFENHDDKVIRGTGWGLWGLIRALSCG